MAEFAVEAWHSARDDIMTMLPAQWAHTGDSDIPCQPNWELYNQFAERGAMITVMARDLDVAIGYLVAFIYPHPNAMSAKIAAIPTYYVVDRPTKALIMSRMVDFTVQKLAERGVYKVGIETNAKHSAGRMWELMGFEIEKIGYTMRLEKPCGERYA